MGAIYYQPDDKNSIFKGNFPVNTMIDIPQLSSLYGEEGAKQLTFITDVSIDNSETIQFFLTFDDVIRYFWFGKGMGNLIINGLIFPACDSKVPGINNLYETIAKLRGEKIKISLTPVVLIAVITNHRLNILTEPTMMVEFQLSMVIIEQQNMGERKIEPVCS